MAAIDYAALGITSVEEAMRVAAESILHLDDDDDLARLTAEGATV
jgi:hypothetical protein